MCFNYNINFLFVFYQRSNTLFAMWNTYETRLPQSYFREKLLNTGDFLFSVKVKLDLVIFANA